MLRDGKRSFKIAAIYVVKHNKNQRIKFKNNSTYTGRYISKDPHGAASKAFTRYCRNEGIKRRCQMIVVMKETTAGSSKTLFAYNASRVNKPTVVDDITHNYKNKLTATSVPSGIN